MKNKFLKVLALLSIALFLNGCCKFDSYLKVSKSGDIDYSGSFALSESLLQGQDIIDWLNDMSVDTSLFQNVTSKREVYDGVYYQVINFKSKGEELAKYLDYKVEKRKINLTIKANDIEDKIAGLPVTYESDAEEKVIFSSFKEYGLKATITVEMPGKIISASCGEIDGNKVSIDLLENMNQEIKIVSKTSDSSTYLLIGLTIIAFLSYYYQKKKA